MVKVFIADDDSIIRRGLKTMIELNTEGFEVIGEAADGLSALELIQKLEADLLITDIKMPVMDGVELVKSIKNRNIDTKSIVLSGYDEYQFVRETLRNGAVDYILKPVQRQNLIELLNKIKRMLENEKKAASNKKDQDKKLEEGTKALKERFLHKWIKGYYINRTAIEDKLKGLGYHNLQSYIISIVRMDYSLSKDMDQANNPNVFLEKVCEQFFPKLIRAEGEMIDVIYSANETEAVIMFLNSNKNADDDFFQQQIKLYLTRLSEDIEMEFKMTATIGCSSLENDPSRAHLSHTQAIMALERKFYAGKGKIISYSAEDCCYKQLNYQHVNTEVEMLLKAVELGDLIKIRRTAEQLFDKLEDEIVNPVEYRDLCNTILMRLCNMLEEFKDAYDQQQNANHEIDGNIQRLDTLKELREYFSDTLYSITEQMNFIRQEKSKRIIGTVKNYILKHFHEDISLKQVAEYVYLNPNYLSELFKMEMGKNFIDFLTEARIDAAKKMIRKNDEKINEVGSMVGYNDPSTFLRAFKKVVGISPSEYKKIVK